MFLLPDHLANEQVLFLWLLDPLLLDVFGEVEQKWGVKQQQEPLETALRQWYLLDHNPLAQEWHQDLVQLLVGVASRTRSAETLGTQVRHLCTKHQIRDRTLLMKGVGISATLLCLIPSQMDLARLSTDGPPLRLVNGEDGQPLFARELPIFPFRVEGSALSWMEAETLLSLVDYVVSEHGRLMLPPLLLAANRHASWQELIPDLFEVSVEEFEAGWHRHIGLSLDED